MDSTTHIEDGIWWNVSYHNTLIAYDMASVTSCCTRHQQAMSICLDDSWICVEGWKRYVRLRVHDDSIWRFPKMGVPLVIIHFQMGFSMDFRCNSPWIFGAPPWLWICGPATRSLGLGEEAREAMGDDCYDHQAIWRSPKTGVPLVIIHFSGVSQYKPSILGYPHFRKPPYL